MAAEQPSITGAMLQRAKGPELVSYLKKLSDELEEYEQTSDQDFLQSVASTLGSAKLLRHRDSDVKLLTACCLSDVLRIFAPENPYENDTLKVVFELFISQLRGLEDVEGASFSRYAYLLERLAMVKSFVLMLDLHFDDLVRQLVEVLLDSASASHPIRVSSHMMSIIVTTLEELGEDGVPTPLLDAILENLLKQNEKPASYHLAQQVLQQCTDDLQQPLQVFIEGCLPTGSGASVESEIREEWPTLLKELTEIMPEIVTYLLPQLQEVICSEDENNRLQGIELLASLFTLNSVNIVHASLIHSFVGKFTDSSVLVRTAMVRHGVELLRQLPPVHAVPIAKALQSRFYDPDENVRTEMVERVCEACKESIGPFAPLLGEVGGRMQDKKTGVKATARANLCALYRQHLSSASLQWVPQKLLQSYGENDGAKNHEGCREIEALVHSTLLPQESEPRLRALCAVHAALLPRHRKVLRLKLLHGKREAQQYVGWWLELQAKLKADPKDKQLKAKTAELVLRMSRPMAEPAKAKEVWEQLGACKDKNVTKHIGALCSASSDYDEVRKADAELRKCMAQRLKSDQKELLSTMMARSSMWLIWRSGATKLLREVTEELRGGGVSGDDELPTLSLLLDVASDFPAVIEAEPLVEAMQSAVPSSNDSRGALLQLLKLAHAANTKLKDAPAKTRSALVGLLCTQACSKDAQTGKLAAQCLTTQLLVPAVREQTFSTLVTKLSAGVASGRAGPQQHCALSALGVLAKRTPEALGGGTPALLRQVMALFEQRSGASQSQQQAASQQPASSAVKARCESQLLALKVLANAAIGGSPAREAAGDDSSSCGGSSSQSKSNEESQKYSRKLAELLLLVLGKNGHYGAAADAGEPQRAQLRLAAACALLKVLRIRELNLETYILEAPQRWHALGFVMQDPNEGVRAGFAFKLAKELGRAFQPSKQSSFKTGTPPHFQHTRKLCVPPYYMCYFALAAVDANKEHVSQARSYLAACCKSFREHAESIKERNPRMAVFITPEVQLPHAIHLLAHHPDIDDGGGHKEDEDDEEGEGAGAGAGALLATQKCLDLFLSTVAAGATPQYDLLRKLLSLIKRTPDRMTPEGREVHVVADVARAILAERTKGGWVQTIVPEAVGLPRHLYSAEQHAPYEDVDMLPHGFSLAEGIAKGSGGAGAGAGGAGGTKRERAAEQQPPPAGKQPAKAKGSAGGSKAALAQGLALPSPLQSPLPSAGSGRIKMRRKGRSAKDNDEHDEDEDEDEAGSEEDEVEAAGSDVDGSDAAGDEEDEEEGGEDGEGGSKDEVSDDEFSFKPDKEEARRAKRAKKVGSENHCPQRVHRGGGAAKAHCKATATAPPAALCATRGAKQAKRARH